VKFNGIALPLDSFSNTQIVATVPAAAPSGIFSLTFTNSQGNSSTFDMTYGVSGPQGPKGPAGTPGGVLSFSANSRPDLLPLNNLALPLDAGLKTITEIFLPTAGTYVIGGQEVISNIDTMFPGEINCLLATSLHPADMLAEGAPQSYATIPRQRMRPFRSTATTSRSRMRRRSICNAHTAALIQAISHRKCLRGSARSRRSRCNNSATEIQVEYPCPVLPPLSAFAIHRTATGTGSRNFAFSLQPFINRHCHLRISSPKTKESSHEDDSQLIDQGTFGGKNLLLYREPAHHREPADRTSQERPRQPGLRPCRPLDEMRNSLLIGWLHSSVVSGRLPFAGQRKHLYLPACKPCCVACLVLGRNPFLPIRTHKMTTRVVLWIQSVPSAPHWISARAKPKHRLAWR
jgi:hypothetical protein